MTLNSSDALGISLDDETRYRRHIFPSVASGGHPNPALPPDAVATFHDLTRQNTLAGDTPGNTYPTSELKTLLGDDKFKLKSKAKIPLPAVDGLPAPGALVLERTSGHSRVELGLFLENDVGVQGGHLNGTVEIHVKRQQKQIYPILLSGGKLRVIGFESILDGKERATFYQCSAALSRVAAGTHRLYTSETDDDGFARTAEGLYTLPFSLPLPLVSESGGPKGKFPSRSGASMRYIIMVSIRVQSSASKKASIAHFYRDCTIWPRLDPSSVLLPAPIPLEVRTPPEIGERKPYMTLRLHRLYWVAGQQCFVQIQVINNSKKPLKSVTLELFQSTTTFKRGLRQGSLQQDKVDSTLNACQATTVNKKVSEAVLTACQPGTKGYASARGWWSGVPPGEHQTFTHSILIPTDALSVARTHLFEVSYMLQAVVGAGSLLSTDTHVAIPIQIINFLSIDPPPVISPSITAEVSVRYHNRGESGSTSDRGMPGNDNSVLWDQLLHQTSTTDADGDRLIHEDDDLLVQHVVSSARPDAPSVDRFTNAYYRSLQGSLDRAEERFHDRLEDKSPRKEPDGGGTVGHQHRPRSHTFASRVEEKRKNIRSGTSHARARSVDVSESGAYTHTSSSIDQGISHLDNHTHTHARAGSHPNVSVGVGNHISSSNTHSNLEPHSYFREDTSNKLERYQNAYRSDLQTSGSLGQLSTSTGESSPRRLHSKMGRQHMEGVHTGFPSHYQAKQGDNIPESDHARKKHEAGSTAFIRPSAMRTQSVKDKIRELEERCASASSGGDM